MLANAPAPVGQGPSGRPPPKTSQGQAGQVGQANGPRGAGDVGPPAGLKAPGDAAVRTQLEQDMQADKVGALALGLEVSAHLCLYVSCLLENGATGGPPCRRGGEPRN